MNDKTAVYRAFSEDGALLYLGVSCDPNLRMKTHRSLSRWGASVSSVTFKWYTSRDAALNAEAIGIFTEKPVFNRTGPTARLAAIFRPSVKVNMTSKRKSGSKVVVLSVTDEDRAEIKAAAALLRLPLATFMRLAALKLARENG